MIDTANNGLSAYTITVDALPSRIYKNVMGIEFDPAKDAANIAKHGVSLSRAADLEIHAVVADARVYGEDRQLAFGMIDGAPYCLVFTIRDEAVRAISLRRAHLKEYRRHVR